MTTAKKRVVFCDFDGTITVNDNIIAIIRHFNPAGWEPIAQDVIAERKSIRQGVGELFALLPASMRDEVIRFATSQAIIRSGFEQFVHFCREESIELYVTSGGIDFFVYPLLKPFGIPSDRIYCNGSDFSGDTVRITWPHECSEPCNNDCGMCKTTIVRRFPPEQYERIVVGDSVTDFAAAKLVEFVYARSHLIEKCEQLHIPHAPFDTFHDIIGHIKQNG
ncbi:2-hydroxy-3-keto-5-methylthiopentenyl-1-phosphate phosphatase [Paenibacillus apiarius]|uniref:2-hydroxy-3-keto-5-methylthiopentenyl-1-phosphate phosphatase n=1 Tax=Paenibacillus apiarius TaxID=46240 RepID=A0ABT4DTS0_9BACL|nr:2-hydroxy-3-keto-5-methylthiopentenyl-1-phosphate phosphatase [Paenibacillus apiarius]MCY9515823.1 2-hydroxy-3-keto-5-methylthiopentenyl-1-phosphate phosphatase [Paenibacillus apiarius]MCY9520733.1 2-hydroxy-3-keto-5-methylthiopentenyl-1-phosphate phosphatase [Paenibacillus apiarius]MCY9553437.1 2-hydroxy-3-keto-5-methylthiopentenyl-1-phosphate phosphatase [Paenibacillus apiarius]MCY9558039.1 2-hydroxy-3-keto-5-methylthiopentenyl-1-phosphate phosphatase [Paenibacillus apiarius]MCY9685894.1 